MSSQPLLSLAVPNYRRAQDLDYCLTYHRRELSARGVDYEIVVVDDASDDDSLAVMEKHAGKDARVRVFANAANIGFRANFLSALRTARGRYVVYLGNDDLLVVDQLLSYVEWLEE